MRKPEHLGTPTGGSTWDWEHLAPEGGSLGRGKFGDNHKVKLGKKRSKTNGVKLSKMASNLWVSLGALAD